MSSYSRSSQGRHRIQWSLLAAVILLLGLFIFYISDLDRIHTERLEQDRLQVQARVIDDVVSHLLEGVNNALASIQYDFLVLDKKSKTLASRRLKVMTDAMPGIRMMEIFNAEGVSWATSQEGRGNSNPRIPITVDMFREHPNPTALHVSSPYKTSQDVFLVDVGRVLLDPTGKFAGMVFATLDPKYFSAALRSVVYAKDMQATLTHGNGIVFISIPEQNNLAGQDISTPGFLFSRHRASGQVVTLFQGSVLPSDGERLMVQRTIQLPNANIDKPFDVAVSRSLVAMYKPWCQTVTLYAVLYGLFALLAALALNLAQRRERALDDFAAVQESERRESAERLMLALSGADLGLWDWHVPSGRLTVNERWCAMLGYTLDEIAPEVSSWEKLTNADDWQQLHKTLGLRAKGDIATCECEHRMQHKDGHWLWVLARGKVMEEDADGSPVRVVGTHMDITERKHAAEEARVLTQRLTLATDAASIGIWDWDIKEDLWYATPTYFSMLGYDPVEGFSDRQRWLRRLHPDDRDAVFAKISAVLAGKGGGYQYEARMLHADETYRWISVIGRVLASDEEGRPVRMLGVRLDITERKQAEEQLQKSEESLAITLQSIGDAVIATDAQGHIKRMNGTAEILTGWPLSEALGRPLNEVFRIVNADSRQSVMDPVERVLKKGNVVGLANHTALLCRDGTEHHISESAAPIRDLAGKIVGVVLVFSNITEQYLVEQALRESEERFRTMVEVSPTGIFLIGLNGDVTYGNPAYQRMTGLRQEDIWGKHWVAAIHPEDRDRALAAWQAATQIGNHYTGSGRYLHKDESIVWWDIRTAAISIDEKLLGYVGMAVDMTDRKQAEENLTRNAGLLNQMGTLAKVGGWDVDLITNGVTWTDEVYRIYELPLMSTVNLEQAISFYAPEARSIISDALMRCMERGESYDLELPFITAKGRHIWARTLGQAFTDNNGKVIRLRGFFHDVTERRAIQVALQSEKARLKAIVDSAADAIIVINVDGSIQSFNPAATQIFGYEVDEVINQSLNKLIPESFHHQQKMPGTGLEVNGRRKSGQQFPMELSISAWNDGEEQLFTAVIRDITERRMVQAQLVQNQKMESLSHLSGGLAHDFNNLLSIIIGNLDSLATRLSADKKDLQSVQAALRAAERGADITRRMLTLSQQKPSSNRPALTHEINPLVEDIAGILRRMLGPSYVLTTSLMPDVYPCILDPAEFENVLLNLAINARDAMPAGGTMNIATRNMTPTDVLDQRLTMLNKQNNYVEVIFADTGCGMSPEVIERAFTPFFTTKAAKGTGLGLTMVYAFVKDLKGYVRIHSEEGAGSTIHLYIPASCNASSVSTDALVNAILPISQGNESVLIVDDEPDLLVVMSAHLSALGYAILTAGSGAEALSILESDAKIDLLLTDVAMPGGMFGTELAVKAKELRPRLAVLLCSGFPQKIQDQPEFAVFAEKIISKPFRKMELATRVREALDAC